MRKSGAYGISLILAILAITCEISWASKQCKTLVMDMHTMKCKVDGERAKRGLERFDLQKYDEKYETKRQEGSGYLKMRDSASHDVPQKRQISPGQISGIALPIVTEAINGAAKARAYSTSGTGYYDSSPSLMGSTLGWSELPEYLRMPYPFGRGFVPFRAPAFTDDLDLYLNDEELDELYNEIYGRIPRAPKDEVRKVFLETASKCCQNINRCVKETMNIPCLGSQMP